MTKKTDNNLGNDLESLSAILGKQAETDRQKKEYARQKYAELNLTMSPKLEKISELLSEIDRIQRILLGIGYAAEKEVVDTVAERLPLLIKEVEDMLK